MQPKILTFRIEGTADENDLRLSGGDASDGIFDRGQPSHFLAHKCARRGSYVVYDRDIAGEKVGKLREKQRRAQCRWQNLFGRKLRVATRGNRVQNVGVNAGITFAAAGRDNEMRFPEQFRVVRDARIFQSQTSGVDTDVLPFLHLAKI